MTTKLVHLEDVSEIVSKGSTPTIQGFEYSKTGIPFLRAEDVQGGPVDLHSVLCRVTPDVHSRLTRSKLQPFDLLVTIAGTLGRVGFVPSQASDVNCNQAVAFARLKPDLIDVKYACYACQSPIVLEPLLGLQKVGTIGNLNLEQLRNLKIPLPSLSEQKRIAGLLEQADRLRRTRRYALELSATFLPAAFHGLFGDPAKEPQWPFVPFGELIESGPQNGLYKPATAYGTGTPIVRIDAYQNGELVDFTELKRVRLSREEVETYGLAAGDFLINRVNSRSHLGKSTLVTKLSEPTVFESNMMRFRVNESVLVPAYALKFLQTRFLNAQIQKQAKDASNQSSINQDDVEGFAILLPPLLLQQKFAALVALHEHLRATQREALRQAEHLFQSLLHRAFNQES